VACFPPRGATIFSRRYIAPSAPADWPSICGLAFDRTGPNGQRNSTSNGIDREHGQRSRPPYPCQAQRADARARGRHRVPGTPLAVGREIWPPMRPPRPGDLCCGRLLLCYLRPVLRGREIRPADRVHTLPQGKSWWGYSRVRPAGRSHHENRTTSQMRAIAGGASQVRNAAQRGASRRNAAPRRRGARASSGPASDRRPARSSGGPRIRATCCALAPACARLAPGPGPHETGRARAGL
jgi:hypothetical protein